MCIELPEVLRIAVDGETVSLKFHVRVLFGGEECRALFDEDARREEVVRKAGTNADVRDREVRAVEEGAVGGAS